MRARLTKALLVTAICTYPHFLLAQGDPIENYLSSAEQKATTVVNSAGAQARGVAMEAGQAALNAIGSFRAAYADSLRSTAAELTGQQALLFSNIRTAVDRLDAFSKDTTTNLQGVADTLSVAVSNLPFSKDIPRVTKVSPLFFADSTGVGSEVVIRGIGLTNGSPVLEYSGVAIRPNTSSDTELRFSLPQHPAVGTQPLLLSTTLRLFERRTKLLFFSSYTPRTYPIRLALYPRQIGELSITPRRRVTTNDTRQQTTQAYRCESPHGAGTDTVPVAIVPTAGWTIDQPTIRYNRSYSNHGSFTMNTTSSTGFTATLSCYGWGRVTALGGIVIDAGSVGVELGTFSYTEFRSGSTLQNAEPLARTLKWGDSLVIPDLPPDTETVMIELRPFTGETLELEGSGSNRFLRLEFNAAAKVATITALGIEQSLGQ